MPSTLEEPDSRSAPGETAVAPTRPICRYAGLGRRFLALLVDLVLFCSVFFPITRLVKGVWLMEPSDHRWVRGWFISDPLCIAFFIVIVLYYILLEAKFGATAGKLLLHLRVIDHRSGGAPGFRKSTIRNVLRLVDGLPALNLIGIVLILVTQERTRVGDLVAETRVVVVQG